MNAQPSQPNPTVANYSKTENNTEKKQSEGEQEVDNETANKYTGQTIKKRKRNSRTSENRTQHIEFNCNSRFE
jgi:hypothetical protein